MGRSVIFWVDEKAIRTILQSEYPHIIAGAATNKSTNPATDFHKRHDVKSLFQPLGKIIVRISLEYPVSPNSAALGIYDNVFNRVGYFHSTQKTLFIWTGNCLRLLNPEFLSVNRSQTILDLCKLSDNASFVYPNARESHLSIVSEQNSWINESATRGDFGIYWLYNDCFKKHDEYNDHLAGQEFLNLLLTNWSNSKSLLSYGNALNKVCSIIKPQFGFFIWDQNCLRKFDGIDKEDLFITD